MSPTWHIVTGDLPPLYTGGIATWVCLAADALHDAGLRVEVHGRAGRGRDRVATRDWDKDQRWPIHRMRGRAWRERQASHVAAHIVPRLEPGDRVLAANWPLATSIWEPCRRLRVPLMVGAHGSEVTRLQQKPAALSALGRNATFIALSNFLANILHVHRIPARVLPLPIQRRALRVGPGRGILVVARLTPLKGVDRVLRLSAATGLPVTVVGDGPEASSLQELARELGAEARFLGRQPREMVERLYPEAAVVALLSREDEDGLGAEGLGLVLVEAAAHGVPGVVSPVGGLPEAVGPGLVLPDPDDFQDAAVRLSACMLDRQAGRRRWEWVGGRHGPRRFVEALLALVREGGEE